MFCNKFNDNWLFGPDQGLLEGLMGGGRSRETVRLPHDAMIHEARSPQTKSGGQTGFYPGGAYRYEKRFRAPEEWAQKTVVFEFEGVYKNARVYINGEYAGGHPYGYSGFYINADPFLRYGEENTLAVSVNNSAEPNSRWYSGSGIYRDVRIHIGNALHIEPDGLRISTPEIDGGTAVVQTEISLRQSGRENRRISVETTLLDPDGNHVNKEVTRLTVYGNTEVKVRQRIPVENPLLWSCDSPKLYACRTRLLEGETVIDEAEDRFGIRKLQLDALRGLRINGTVVKLRGTCIHHDNGIIGACTLENAEERRCRLMKEAGFNCIRSAHHPISRAMLNACDRLGMLVMDELWDMWSDSKNSSDYGMEFADHWRHDVQMMVSKDFNHPSVILYSMGNELKEAAYDKGAELNRTISNLLHSLDDTRYTTNALNGLMMSMSNMEEMISDILGKPMTLAQMMDDVKSAPEGEENAGGSDALNGFMSFTSGAMADKLAVHPYMTDRIDGFAGGMDVAGYNYMTGRHEREPEFSPNRVVLGTETYPAEIVRLWSIVKRNAHVIGDMTWTGYDYLGEAGCGIFYYDGTQNFSSHWPDRLAYIGDIDITGYRRPISFLREIVFGLRKAPYAAVVRMNRGGQKPSGTPWMWKDNVESWTWPGHEGENASVDVYSSSAQVELFINGKSQGRLPAGEKAGFVSTFSVPYEAGELKAVSYDEAGNETGTHGIATAEDQVALWIEADRETLRANGSDLCYITVELRDQKGVLNMNAVRTVAVSVEGPATVQGFGSGNPQGENSYDDRECETYDGRVQAAIRAGTEKGGVTVKFSAQGCETAVKTIMIL